MTIMCKVCVFWDQHQPEQNSENGDCHRHAPFPVALSGSVYSNWMITRKHDWCGEGETNNFVIEPESRAGYAPSERPPQT